MLAPLSVFSDAVLVGFPRSWYTQLHLAVGASLSGNQDGTFSQVGLGHLVEKLLQKSFVTTHMTTGISGSPGCSRPTYPFVAEKLAMPTFQLQSMHTFINGMSYMHCSYHLEWGLSAQSLTCRKHTFKVPSGPI